jgi:hypothetical protein
MDDDIDPAQAIPNEVGVGDRADLRRKGRLDPIEPHHLLSTLPEGSDETFTEVPGASSHEHAHPVPDPS